MQQKTRGGSAGGVTRPREALITASTRLSNVLTSAPRKVLFFAEAVTLAHVARVLFLAQSLRGAMEIEIACSDAFGDLVRRSGLRTRPLHSISPATFLARLSAGSPAYTEQDLKGYVVEDSAIIKESRPDVIIGDFRLSLSVSARVARIPYVNVTNAYWSPYAHPVFRMPNLPLSKYIASPVADAIFRMLRPLAFAVHSLPLNRVRHSYGLSRLPPDVRHSYCDGDLTMYADLPQLVPIKNAPPSHVYIGPVMWSTPMQPPTWWPEATARGPIIYVSLGSSGAVGNLPLIIDALLPLGRAIVVSTAGRQSGLRDRPGVWVTDYLAGDLACANASVVVCNGGSPSSMQALAHGVPVVGIISNMDQMLNMTYVEQFGAGRVLSAAKLKGSDLQNVVKEAIERTDLRQKANSVGRAAANLRADVEFPERLAAFMTGAPQTVTH